MIVTVGPFHFELSDLVVEMLLVALVQLVAGRYPRPPRPPRPPRSGVVTVVQSPVTGSAQGAITAPETVTEVPPTPAEG